MNSPSRAVDVRERPRPAFGGTVVHQLVLGGNKGGPRCRTISAFLGQFALPILVELDGSADGCGARRNETRTGRRANARPHDQAARPGEGAPSKERPTTAAVGSALRVFCVA